MASLVLWITLVVILESVAGESRQNKNEGLINTLSNGMKFAKDFLSSESVAMKVAEFVMRAFQPKSNQRPSTNRRPTLFPNTQQQDEDNAAEENKPYFNNQEPSDPMTPLSHLVRLFGLQPTQMSAVAINALVFVAQMISMFLSGPKRPPKSQRSEDPTSWILNKNSQDLQDLIGVAKNESLPDLIEDLIKNQGSEEETSCIRLLVCKITPFVSKMQKAVFGKEKDDDERLKDLRGSAMMYLHLPSASEINKRSDVCEQRHRNCNLNE